MQLHSDRPDTVGNLPVVKDIDRLSIKPFHVLQAATQYKNKARCQDLIPKFSLSLATCDLEFSLQAQHTTHRLVL